MRLKFCVLFFLSTVLILGVSARAQLKIPSGGGTSTATRPESVQDSGPMGYWADMDAQGRAGGALLGKLTVAGEPFLWEPVPVFVTCNGSTTYTTETDSKGNFLIRPNKLAGAGPDLQGDTKRQMETHLEGCNVQAFLTGFNSSTITITHHNLRDETDLGTLMLRRAPGAAGTALSGSRESIPANALKPFDKARSEMISQKPDRAQLDLQKAVEIYPQFAEAWYQLGRLQISSAVQTARQSFQKAIAADPTFVLPYEQLAAIASQDAQWKEVLENTNHVLQLDPAGTPQVWYYDALANVQLGKVAAAKASALKSLEMDPLHTVPNTEQLLGVILTMQRDYSGALAHLRNCLTYLPDGSNADLVKRQIAQLEHLAAVAK